MFTVSDVAKILLLKEATIREYLKSGKLKGSQFGRKWRIAKEDLDKFIEENKHNNERK